MELSQAAASFGLILLCLGIGYGLRRSGALPARDATALNVYVTTVALPAVALLNLHGVSLERAALFPVAMAWLVFGAASAFFALLGRAHGWSRGRVGALILTGGLGNTSFVGFPLLIALYGPTSLRTGILTDQPGTFLALASVGVLAASYCSARGADLRQLPGKLLRFPPFVAMLAAFALRGWEYPAALHEILEKLSATLIPVALVSVGLQLRVSVPVLRRHAASLAAGLGFKLLLAPAGIALLYAGLLHAHGPEVQITIVEAAMAPMITGAILAADYGLDPELANLMVGVGIPLSLFSVPLWAWLLRSL